jgi:hypothetical protein
LSIVPAEPALMTSWFSPSEIPLNLTKREPNRSCSTRIHDHDEHLREDVSQDATAAMKTLEADYATTVQQKGPVGYK